MRTAAAVAERAGVSRGSLDHHWGDAAGTEDPARVMAAVTDGMVVTEIDPGSVTTAVDRPGEDTDPDRPWTLSGICAEALVLCMTKPT